MQQIRSTRFEEFFYRAMKMRFFELQYEAKKIYDWEEEFAFGFGKEYQTRTDIRLAGHKAFVAYNTGSLGGGHRRIKYRDIEHLARDNDYLARNAIKYLPDSMVDPSIINLLKRETGLLPQKQT